MAAKKRGRGQTKEELVLVAGRRPQMRKASARSWTRAKQETFLTALAETCNITRACKIAGVSQSTVDRKRKSDAAFRAGFLDAIACAYERLELLMLERSLNGSEKVIIRKDGSEERMREYPNQLGLALLKMHRETAAQANTSVPTENVEELRDRVLQKMLRLKKRLEPGE